MPRYEITSPDGRKFEVTAPEGASQGEVLAYAQANFAKAEAPKTTALGQVKEGFKGVVPGAVGLLESAATGASALLPEGMEKSAREKIKSVATAAKAPFAADAGYEDSVGRKLGEAVGSTAPFLLAGPLGLAGRAAAVGLGVGAGAGEARTRAEEAGATGAQRGTATALGIIPGALEAFAPIRVLSRIPTASKAAGVEAVKRALVAGGEEAAQEAASGFAQNLIAKGVYKPEQALIEGLGEQAAYGGATGAIVQGLMDLALGRRARGAQAPQEKPQAPEAKPEPVVPAPQAQAAIPAPEAQAALPAPAERLALPNAPTPESAAEAIQERERLKSRPQTADLAARVEELDALIDTYNQSDIEVIREEQAQKKAEAAKATADDAEVRRRFPGLVGAVEEEAVAPGAFTMQNVVDTGISVGPGVKAWAAENIVGKTQAELQALVAKVPALLEGKTQRTKLLRELLAPQPAKFEEALRVEPTPTATPAVEQRAEPGASEPSVGVPSEPAIAELPEPGAGVSAPTEEPVASDGLGLVSAGRPAVPGVEAQRAEPAAVTADQLHTQVRGLVDQQQALLSKSGQAPRGGTAKAAQWAELDTQIADLKSQLDVADRAGRANTAEPKAPAAAEKTLQEKLQAIIDDSTASKRSKQTAFAALDSLTDPDLNETAEERQQNEAYAEKELQSAEKQRRFAAPRGNAQTLSELEQEIQNMPGKLGDAVRKMRRTGKLKLEEGDGSQGGLYDGKRATLYARGTPKGQALGMLLHEVGAHMGMRNLLGQKQYDAVIDRIAAMLKAPDGSLEKRLAATAYDRIPEQDRARGAEVARDELVAYFVEGVAYAEADGQLPKRGPLRVVWDQIKTAITTSVNRALGTSFGINDLTPQQIADIATAAIFRESETGVSETAEVKQQFSVAPSTETLIDSMGPMEVQEKPMLRKVIDGFKAQDDIGYATKFRTQAADSAATIEHRLREQFDGAVKDKLGKFNPMGLYRQAQDYSKMLLEYLQVGSIAKEPATGLWKVKADPKVRPPVEVYALIDKWAAKNGYSRERGTQIASRILEGVRLNAMRDANTNDGAGFLLHLKDNEIDQLVREYKADPDLQAMSKVMDEARLAMVDNMVAVGRLSAEQGQLWKDAAGYVPFDRIEDFATSFAKIKKISNKGLAQVGKLPELVGSINRPVGNVFDNYLNTLGWMVGQTLKTDGTVQTLRSLEDAGHAKYLGLSPQGKDNVVGMYVKGEMMYWEVPSKYDVLAFKDLNPPKAKWLQVLGQASNVLRKAVTSLPPFALKQVTDDVQRAIMTSGVKNPGALLRMTLSNFGGLALAELRGIQHPAVKQFGALGLTGEYDFQQGKPAASVLKDLGYKPRGKFETLMHRLDGITRASDLAVRKAIFDQTMKESQGDELLAQTRAREFINFRRRGASDFVGAMVTTIPFFNAYIQGMDVLYRAASGKDSSSSVGRAQARRMFWSRAAIVMALSSLYALGKGDDDEEYNEMDLRTRDSNWILPGGVKLPVPSELGALFKVVPERVVEYMRRQGTPEEQTAWEATRTALSYIFEQYVGRTVPVPQGVKPLLEAWTNYSFFTGRELEGIYQKQQDPSLRRASNTSELAIAIAEFSKNIVGVDKVSPILIDNALNGYFGSSAGLLVAMTDSLLNPTRVDRPLHKWALVSNYMYDPVGTRRMTEFYEEREKVGRANTTLNELMKTDLDKAAAYAEEHADELMLESAVNSTLEQLERTRAYKKHLNSPAGAEDMSKEEREASIKEVRQMELELTGWLREAKASMRQ